MGNSVGDVDKLSQLAVLFCSQNDAAAKAGKSLPCVRRGTGSRNRI